MFGKLKEKASKMWESFKNTRAGKFVAGSKQKIADLFNQKPEEVKSDKETKNTKVSSTSSKDLGDIQREMDSKDKVVMDVSQIKLGDNILLQPHILRRFGNGIISFLKKWKKADEKFAVIRIDEEGRVILKSDDGKEIIWDRYKFRDFVAERRIIKVGKKLDEKEDANTEKKPTENTSPIEQDDVKKEPENKESAPNDVEIFGKKLKQNINNLFGLKDKKGFVGTLDLDNLEKIGENKYMTRFIKGGYEVRIFNHNGYTKVDIFRSGRYEYELYLNDNVVVQKVGGPVVFNSSEEKDDKFIEKTKSIMNFLDENILQSIETLKGENKEKKETDNYRDDYLNL